MTVLCVPNLRLVSSVTLTATASLSSSSAEREGQELEPVWGLVLSGFGHSARQTPKSNSALAHGHFGEGFLDPCPNHKVDYGAVTTSQLAGTQLTLRPFLVHTWLRYPQKNGGEDLRSPPSGGADASYNPQKDVCAHRSPEAYSLVW